MKEIIELVQISKYAGERFDLVQAGGGNTSVKLDNGQMLIKASGFALSELTIKTGYSVVITNEVAEIIRNNEIVRAVSKREREVLTAKWMKKATIDTNNRPSIETLLHSVLLKYTLHTHPIALNIILSQSKWKGILNSIFKNDQIALVGYHTPGIDLAIELNKEINRDKTIPRILFLQNHGMIITSDKIEEIEILTEYVLNLVEAYLNIDLSKFKLTTQITNLLKDVESGNNISYLSNDVFLNDLIRHNKKLFFEKPFCPDTFVFCGICAIEIKNIFDLMSIKAYIKQYKSLPKVILYDSKIFIISESVKKAKEIEDVLKFHLFILSHNDSDINFLPQDELNYLGNWEAEKFRQKL